MSLPESMPAHRKHQRVEDKLAKCIQYIKDSNGGGFKSFGDFMISLFTDLPTDSSSGTDSAYQTVTQTVRAFLSWNPLTRFLNKISSHAVMAVNDGNMQGIVPPYCVSPGLSVLGGMIIPLQCVQPISC